jgi:hypothetical protein
LGWFLLLAATAAGPAQEKKKQPPPSAVVGGTVFREPGFALPGAEVTIEAGEIGRKFKKMKAVTDHRGEFLFRLPPGPAAYKVSARAKGFETQEKQVSVSGEEHQDVFFQLKPLPR